MNGKKNEIQCQRVTEVLATRCNRRQERESRNYPTRAAGKRESTVNTLLEPPRNRVTRGGGEVCGGDSNIYRCWIRICDDVDVVRHV